MLSQRFEQLFRRLLTAFVRYDETPRRAANVVRLAVARAHLDDVRRDIALERDDVMRVGRSRIREDFYRVREAIARDELFMMANTSN